MLASLASGLLIGIVKFLVIVYSFSKMRTIATAQFFQISFCYFFQAGSTVISRLLRATISPSVVSREWSVVGAAATSNSGSVCSSEPRRRSSVRRLMRGLTSWDFLRQMIVFQVALLRLHFLSQVDTVGILGSMGMRLWIDAHSSSPQWFLCFFVKIHDSHQAHLKAMTCLASRERFARNRTCPPASHFGEWAPKDSKTLTSHHSCWGASGGQNFRMISIV